MRKLLPLILALVLPLTACGDGDGPTDPTEAAVGTYTMVRYNGSTLPALFEQYPERRADVVGGTFTLRSDRSYTEVVTLRFTPTTGPVETESFTENGTFTVNGNTVNFRVNNGFTYSGTLSGNTLTDVFDGLNPTYQKQ